MTPEQQYILDRSIPIPFAGCWLWLRALTATGYGHTGRRGRWIKGHRLAYEAFVGPIPDGMLVQHSCDNAWCVNPDHLSIGTNATNNLDKQRKGRAAKKLSAGEIADIRSSRETDVGTARRFGVSRSMVNKIRARDNWDHIPGGGRNRNPEKITMVAACLMRHLHRRGERIRTIANAFGVRPGYAQHVLMRRRWNDWSRLVEVNP